MYIDWGNASIKSWRSETILVAANSLMVLLVLGEMMCAKNSALLMGGGIIGVVPGGAGVAPGGARVVEVGVGGVVDGVVGREPRLLLLSSLRLRMIRMTSSSSGALVRSIQDSSACNSRTISSPDEQVIPSTV